MPNLLIVEPDRQLAETLQKFFENEYDVFVCHDAQSAISVSDTNKPDAVVLELAMAEHNGIAFLQEFRSYGDWLEVPVIIYSHIPRDDAGLSDAEWSKLGVVNYLYKPTFSLDKLGKAVREVITAIK